MQAKDFYEIGIKAYNGDENSINKYFQKLSGVAISIAPKYGLLPSYVMAKSVCESGFMTDAWNATAERLTGQKFKRKAQDYNNIFGMNNWKENQQYLSTLPMPKWNEYKTEFQDWGPHGYGNTFHVKMEPWKSYKCIEDAIEDWCANIRCQSAKHGFAWDSTDLKSQLLATESYTPEGSPESVRKGLHYQWQESIMKYFEKYNLGKYDEEVRFKVMQKVEMFEQNLDSHIAQAYKYAHANCHYERTDESFPPFEDSRSDCAGLALRALYTMGYNTGRKNIDQLIDLCKSAGMKMSTDINDVWRHHGIVCMQFKNNIGTWHIGHVFYSLGGTSINSISKYDLGSDDRIKKHVQPYVNVPVNEWTDTMIFKCLFYADKKPEPKPFENKFSGKKLFDAIVKSKNCVAREYGGKVNKLLFSIPKGTKVPVYAAVSTGKKTRWFYIKYNGKYGWVYKSAFEYKYMIPKDTVTVTGTKDNSLTCRVGAGVEYPVFAIIPSLKNGTKVRVLNNLVAADGTKWMNVYYKGYLFFLSSMYLK